MLSAAGIFDLFFWRTLVNSFDHIKNPASIFGMGLSINVFGVWVGGQIGKYLVSVGAQKHMLSYIGLGIVFVSMLILLPLNNKLSVILNHNEFLVAFSHTKRKEMIDFNEEAKLILSNREYDVFSLLIKGKTDSEMSDLLYISHHTIKTHNRNIFKKLNVKNRLELISKISGQVK